VKDTRSTFFSETSEGKDRIEYLGVSGRIGITLNWFLNVCLEGVDRIEVAEDCIEWWASLKQ
jgi:hypothetical protein